MGSGQAISKDLKALAGEILAIEPDDKDALVDIGSTLEESLTEGGDLPELVSEGLALVLQGLQGIYQDSVSDALAAMGAIATIVSGAAATLTDGDTEGSDELRKGIEQLRGLLPSDEDTSEQQTAEESSEPESSDQQQETEDTSNDSSEEEESVPEVSDVLSAEADPELLGEFIVECLDHITAAEGSLLELESNPEDSEQINTIFRAFHTIKGTSGFLGLERVQRLAHLAENLLDRGREGEIKITGGYADLALKSCDMLRTMIESLDGLNHGDPLLIPDSYGDLIEQLSDPETAGIREESDTQEMRLGDILVGKGKVDREQVERAAEDQGTKRLGETLIDQKAAKPTEVADALRVQKKAGGASASDKSIRVTTGRLDILVNLVGELVIAQSMVAQDPTIAERSHSRLARSVVHSGKIVRELQDMSMSLRMVPLKGTFQKMARLMRDLGRKAHKSVRFATEGEDTEIDRNMVEVLNDPLVHMMRNAIDHGIESPEQRESSGKDPCGTVRLRAFHSGGNVVLELRDDGKGLDRDRIIAKAIDRGLIDSDRDLSDSEIFALIFHPGFSTAEKVTDVSGRGVGMDVVKKGIDSLRGRIEVTSRPGEGSTFTVRLPLTMAITDAMLVRVAAHRYLVPTVSIEMSFRPKREVLSTVSGRGEIVMVRGDLLPIFKLHCLFNVDGAVTDPTEGLLVIVEGEGRRFALMVDELLGQQQVVIKSLGRTIGQIPGVAGGAILGDGRVGLILDVAGLLQLTDEGRGALEQQRVVA